MGMFDFIAEAGEKIKDAVTPGQPVPDIEESVEVRSERVDQLRRESIERKIAALDIDGEQVTVAVDGPTATLSGTAPNQEALEKMVLCAGNQFGIARVDCQLEVPEALAQAPDADEAPAAAGDVTVAANFYTVQRGDTLSGIAQAHYGDASKYMTIFEANRPMLEDPDRIYPGQQLRIPPKP